MWSSILCFKKGRPHLVPALKYEYKKKEKQVQMKGTGVRCVGGIKKKDEQQRIKPTWTHTCYPLKVNSSLLPRNNGHYSPSSRHTKLDRGGKMKLRKGGERESIS